MTYGQVAVVERVVYVPQEGLYIVLGSNLSQPEAELLYEDWTEGKEKAGIAWVTVCVHASFFSIVHFGLSSWFKGSVPKCAL